MERARELRLARDREILNSSASHAEGPLRK